MVLLLLFYVVLLCCRVKRPPHRNSKSRVYPPLRRQDSEPPTRSYTADAAAGVAVQCCCCRGSGARTHTKPVPLTSGYIIPRRGRLTATERRLWETQLATYYSGDSPPHQEGAGPPSTASIVLSVRAAKTALYVSHRAPPLAMLVSWLGKRRDHSGRHHQSPTFVPTKPPRNSCFIGRAWPNCPAFCSTFRKNPNKKFLRYRRCAVWQLWNSGVYIYWGVHIHVWCM